MFKTALASEIMAYLTDHPHAQDTKEGIVEWWLLHQRAESVEMALSELVENSFLEEFKGPDAKVHYRITGKKRDELQKLRAPGQRRCK